MTTKKIYLFAAFVMFSFGIIAQQVLLMEDFNTGSGTTPPTGWGNVDLNGSGILWTFNNEGYRTLAAPITNRAAIFDSDHFSSNGTTEKAAMVSPVFDASAGIISLEFDHYFYNPSGADASYHVEVWNGTSWNQVLSGDQTLSNNPGHVVLNITTAAGSSANAKVRFRWLGSYDYYWIVDNVKVSKASCPFPSHLAVMRITQHTAGISWAAGGSETNWNVQYGPAGFTLGTGTTATSSTEACTLSGLIDATDYDVYVQSNCGGTDHSIWIGPISFSTICVIPAITSYPWTENFDGSCESGVIENSNSDNKLWTLAESFSFNEYNSAPNCLHIFQNHTLAMDDWYYLPNLIMTAGVTYQFEFKYKCGFSDYPEKLTVYLGTAQTPTAMTTELVNLSPITNIYYQTATANFSVPASGSYYVGFHGHSDPDQFFIGIDDVKISECLGCPLTTSLEEDILSGIDLYPNPTNGVLHVTSPATNGSMSVSVIDFAGKEVLIVPNAVQGAFELDLSGLDNGVYFVKFLSESIQQIRRIMLTN